MKAITIHQPWATLIALGEKQFETRGWPTKHRGPIAIHAGKKIDREACQRFAVTLIKNGYITFDDLPTGAIVATANLTECWEVSRCLRGDVVLERDGGNERREDPISKKEESFGYYDDGRYAWELDNVQRFPKPVEAIGRQGLWNWKEEGRT